MSDVPGGDVTLHAAITETLVAHRLAHNTFGCICGWDMGDAPDLATAHRAHLADRVMAVLADRLPHTPPDQLAGLIGGTVQTIEASDVQPYREDESRVVGPWVPDSPPAAPEPRQDT